MNGCAADRRRWSRPRPLLRGLAADQPGRPLEAFAYREAGIIGVFQTAALFAGISRSGITMVAGLLRGLNHEDAARFSFLLATPIIVAPGLLKLPQLLGPAAASFAVRFWPDSSRPELRRTSRFDSCSNTSKPALSPLCHL